MRTVRLAVLAAMLCASSAHAERRAGQVVVYQVDDFAGHRAQKGYQLREPGHAVPTPLSFVADPGLQSGQAVVVDGSRGPDGAFAVEQVAIARDAAPFVSNPPAGDQRTAIMLLGFNDAANACTSGQVEPMVFTDPQSVSSLYQEASFQHVSFSGTTFGPFLIDDYRSQHCDPFGWAYQADLQAAAAGIDLTPFPRRLYVIATHPQWTCGWGGISQLGIVPSVSVSEGYGACGYAYIHAHELGHALGMGHASTDTSDDGVIDYEYGDVSDFMGAGSYVHPNAPHKLEMGWLAANDVPLALGNTRVGLRPLELPPAPGAGLAGIRIPKGGTNDVYFVSFRRQLGFDVTLDPLFADRVNVHTQSALYASANTLFVGALGTAQSFHGPDFAVTYLESSASGAFVEVAFSCEPFAPEVHLSEAPLARPGASTTLDVSVRNDDTVLCTAAAFEIATAVPAGWASQATPTSLQIEAKASATGRITLTIPAATPDGTYNVTVTIEDASQPVHRFEQVVRLTVAACREGCETCGNGKHDAGEECDDAPSADGDGCDANCTTTRCGNGISTTGEDCDDGNLQGGDGCSAACEQECAVLDDCDDEDPCTSQACAQGLCDFTEPFGYEGAFCTVGELTRTPVCGDTALPRKLATKLEQTATKADAALHKAQQSVKPKQAGKLLAKANRQLLALESKASKLVAKEKLDPGCGAAIAARATRPRAIIAALGGPDA